MRTVLGLSAAGLLLAAAGCGRSDADRLVGRWEATGDEVAKGARAVVEFTADGRVIGEYEVAGKSVKDEGTYTLDGKTLTVTRAAGVKQPPVAATVTRLTADELVIEDGKKKSATYRRAR